MNAPVILDAAGVPITSGRRGSMRVGAYGDTKHNAASQGRELRRWQPGNGSADSDINPELNAVNGRAADLLRNAPSAIAPVVSEQHALVGAGLSFQPAPLHALLGKDEDWALEFADRNHPVMDEWVSSTECDASGYGNLDRMAHLVTVGVCMKGGMIAIPVWQPEMGLSSDWGTAIQLVEIDRMCNPNNGMDTRYLSGGVEINDRGAALAYHLMTCHPGDLGKPGFEYTWERIPAWTEWRVRPRLLHIFNKDRAGQNRGLSMLSPLIADLHTLDRAERYELEASMANAMIAFFAKIDLDQDALADLFDGDMNALMEFRNKRKILLGSQPSGAKVIPLLPQEEITPHVSQRPNTNFSAFGEMILRRGYGALGQAYEIGSKNLGSLNYSAARGAANETWRTWETRRTWLVDGFCRPAYRLAFEEAVNRGRIWGCTPEDLYGNFIAYSNSDWNGPGKGWLDPVKEAEGATMRVSSLFSTLQKECADQGLDWRKVIRQQWIERQFCERYGIPYTSVTGMPGIGGMGGAGGRSGGSEDGQQQGQEH